MCIVHLSIRAKAHHRASGVEQGLCGSVVKEPVLCQASLPRHYALGHDPLARAAKYIHVRFEGRPRYFHLFLPFLHDDAHKAGYVHLPHGTFRSVNTTIILDIYI